MSTNGINLSLKIMVDTKVRKVVFAEAGKEFVDFLFHILSLPLSTVVKLLNKEEMIGSLPALYKSVKSLKTEYYAQNVSKDTVLQPKRSINVPLLSLNHVPATLNLFKCEAHNCVSDYSGATCLVLTHDKYGYYGSCNKPVAEVQFIYAPRTSSHKHPGFVMDDLEVKPMSITLIKSLVNDFDFVAEEELTFGPNEGLTLLRASLKTTNVLTTVFLEVKKEDM